MSDNENKIPLEVLVEIKDALGRLEKFETEAKKSTSNVEKAFEGMKTAAKAAVAVFAAKQVVDFFASGIDAAIAQEDAMNRLATAMDATGEKTDEALQHFKEFADNMEATTKYGDDLVISQVAIAKSFGLSNDEAEKLVKTAADLASATGDTLDGAVQKLGKTYGGMTGKLDDMVPALRGLTKEQLANGEAVRILGERYGGAAAKEVETFSGALLQTKNAFGNLQESFGAVIVDNKAVTAAIAAVGDVFRYLEGIVAANSDTLGAFVGGSMKLLVVTAAASAEALGLLNEMIGVFTTKLIDGVANVTEITAGLLSFIPGMESAAVSTANFADSVRDVGETAGEGFGKVQAGLNGLTVTIDNAAQKVFNADEKITTSAEKATAARKGFARSVVEDAKEVEKLAEAARKLDDSIRQSTADEVANIQAKLQETLRQIQEFEDKRVFAAKHAEELRVLAVDSAMQKIAKIQEEALKKQSDADKQAAEEFKKLMDERRAAVEAAGSNPWGYIGSGIANKAGASPLDISPETAQGLSAGVGATTSLLSGRDGAVKAVSGIGAAVADAFIPGIGAAVGPLLEAMSKGPEATKSMVREFVEAVPDIVTAIAESAPVIVEALVDSLINEGGLVRIAVALGKALLMESWFKAIGKQIGLEFGRSFNAGPLASAAKTFGSNMVSSIGDGLKSAFKSAAAGAGQITAQAIREAFVAVNRKLLIEVPTALARGIFVELPGALRAGFQAGISALGVFFTQVLPQAVSMAFQATIDFFRNALPMALRMAGSAVAETWRSAGASIANGVKDAGGVISERVREGIGQGLEAAREAVGNFVANVKEVIGGIWAPIRTALNSFKFPNIPTPAWLRRFIDTVDNLTTTPAWVRWLSGLVDDLYNLVPDLGGGGGGGGLVSGTGTPLDRLSKGGTIPPGFPNDSFHAAVESGEVVVPRNDVRDLRAFLDREASGGGSAGVAEMMAYLVEAVGGLVDRPVEVSIDGAVVARSVQRNAYRNARMTR